MKSNCVRSWSEIEFQMYEEQLRDILKKDKDHKFPFDKKMLYHSRRYGCTFAAVDIHLDEKTHEMVMVGSVRNGALVKDEKTGDYEIKKQISVPFREVYDDLKEFGIPGSEMRFIDKTKKAVIDKYIVAPMLVLQNRYAFQGDTFNFSDFFSEKEMEKLVVNHLKLRRVSFGEDGKVDFGVRNELTGDEFIGNFGNVKLDYYYYVGQTLNSLLGQFDKCKKVFLDRLHELEPVDMSYSERQRKEHWNDAISKMMESDNPETIKYALMNYYKMNRPFLSESEKKNINEARESHQRHIG